MPTQAEFLISLRQKYPQYQDIDDSTLVSSILEKYPVYRDQISDFGQSLDPQPLETPVTPTFQPTAQEAPQINPISITNMKPLAAGTIIDDSDGSFPVKERKLGLLKTAVNSYIQGSWQLVDMVGGGLIWSGLNEDFGKSIRDFSKEIQAKYDVPMLSKQFELEDLKNPEFYFANIPQMIPMLTALIPLSIAGGAGGAAVATTFKLGKWTGMGVTALSAALASRPIESAMEAVGTYNDLIDQGVDKEKAGEAASDVFINNMALIGMDAGQYALAFMKVHPALRQSLGKWISSTGARAVGFAAASVSEGWEEVIQGYFQALGQASAKGEAAPDLVKALKLSSPEAKKEFVLGTMMGVGFQTAGAISGKDILTDNDINRIIDEQIIISEVNDGAEPADVKEQKIVDALNVGLEEAGLGLGLEEKIIEKPKEEPTAVKTDIKAEPIQAEPAAVAKAEEKVEPAKPIEKPAEKVVVEKPEKAEKPKEVSKKIEEQKYAIGTVVLGVADQTKSNPTGRATIQSYNSATGEYTFESDRSSINKDSQKLREGSFDVLGEKSKEGVQRYHEDLKTIPENEREQARQDSKTFEDNVKEGKYDSLFFDKETEFEWQGQFEGRGGETGKADFIKQKIAEHFELVLTLPTQRAKALVLMDSFVEKVKRGEEKSFAELEKIETDKFFDSLYEELEQKGAVDEQIPRQVAETTERLAERKETELSEISEIEGTIRAEEPKKPEVAIVPKEEEIVAEAKLPTEKPIVEPIAELKRVATVEEIEKSRKKYHLADIPLDEARKWVAVFKRAEKRKPEALSIAESISRKPRVLTNDEFAVLSLQKTEVEDLIDESQSDIAKAVDEGNVKEQERHSAIMETALGNLDEITTALRFSNREAGRALNIIQVALRKEGELYKVSKILQMAKIVKGVKLTPQEISELSELGRKIDVLRKRESSLTKEIESLQEKLSKQDAIRDFKKTTRTISRERSQATLKTERADLFKSLNAIGYRLNDVMGLTYESATIVSKLAINYFESGVKELDAIVEKIQTKVPDLSKKNVYDSLGGRIKKTKKTVVSATKQEITELKTQARLMGEIEDAYNGIFEQSKKRKVSSAKILNLQKKLKELKRSAFQSIRDQERLNNILLRIDNVQDQLITGARDIRKTKRADSPDIRNAKQELSELRQLISNKDKIADLENQLKTGNFKVPVKIQRVVKSADLLSTQVKLTQLRREVRERIRSLKKRTRPELFIEIITLPRLLRSIADVSMVLRQGLPIAVRHPVKTLRFMPTSLKTFFSQNKADELDVWIRKHENQPIREKAELFLSSIESPLNQREEFFVSSLGEQIPYWGRVVKASNRHAVSHLNFIRVMAFDQFLETYPNATSEVLHTWARLINIMSGRGDLGSFNKVANSLSLVAFSPRFSTSRIQLPFEVLRHRNWKHPSVRKEMSKYIMSYISMTGTILFLASLAGLKVGMNPDDPDFLKMRVKDTTFDIFGGFLQPIRVIILAILTALETAGIAKIKGTRDLRSAVERFLRYKLAPAVTIPFELVTGETAVGEETTPVGTFARNVTPLAFEDLIDTYKYNPALAPIVAPLVLLGVGVNTYKRKRRIRRSIKR